MRVHLYSLLDQNEGETKGFFEDPGGVQGIEG